MSSSFVTLGPNDPEYRDYLLGRFSRSLRALPVESFSQHSRRERVTFQLQPIDEIEKPTWWRIYIKACRPDLLGLTLGPFLLTALWLMKASGLSQFHVAVFLSSLCGLFFLHVSSFLFNDFRDHMQGVDFANRRRGSQVIQKGWASALEVRFWAWVNALLALLFGAPAIFLHFETVGSIAALAAASVMALSWMTSTIARRGLSDLLVFFSLGPLLTSASALVGFDQISGETLWLGVALGALAVLTLQIRQIENLFRAGRDSFRTFVGALDFDRAKKMLLIQIVAVGALQLMTAGFLLPRFVAVVGFAFALVPIGFVYVRLKKAASPLSSDLVRLGQRAVLAQAALLVWWGAAIWI